MFARIIVSVALVLLFAGCASYDSGYRDGAYYRPAHGSEGDYYYGRPVPQQRGYYSPYYGPYGTPFYYSPYPYYQPHRYRPYYGPYRSSYYRSGFGASYAYGGFAGYRDYGYSGFGLGLVYSERDRYRDRGRHDGRDRYGHDERGDEHHRSDRDRHDERDQRSERFGVAPSIGEEDRRNGWRGRPGYPDEPYPFERRRTQPLPPPRATPAPTAAVRWQPGAGRVVQMRRVDTDEAGGKNRFKQARTAPPAAQPLRGPSSPSRDLRRPDTIPAVRGTDTVEWQQPRRDGNGSAPPSSRAPTQMRSPQRGLNEPTRDSGKKPRNASHLENTSDQINE